MVNPLSRFKAWRLKRKWRGWEMFPPYWVNPMQDIHVFPTFDIIDHYLTDECICCPEVEEQNGDVLVYHHHGFLYDD